MLKSFFDEHSEVAVALSGGIDSAFLLYQASRYADRVRAYYVSTEFQPRFEQKDAVDTATSIGVPIEVIPLSVLDCGEIFRNREKRCYYCKRAIMGAVVQAAAMDGIRTVLDGTNASDDVADRPGFAALKELGILSPLRLYGVDKDTVRTQARKAGLKLWEKPAYACLATRIQTGIAITEAELERTERSEEYMMSLGFSDFRVRTRDGCAVVQLRGGQRQLYLDNETEICEFLGRFYDKVILDEADRGRG